MSSKCKTPSDAAKAALATSDANRLVSIARACAKIPTADFVNEGYHLKRLAVLGGVTTTLIVQVLKSLLLSRKIYLEIYESEYGLFEQAIHARAPELFAFKPDLLWFCVGTENLGRDLPSEAARWQSLWQSARDWLGCEVIQNTFEEPLQRVFGNLELKQSESLTRFVRQLNLNLTKDAPSFVHFNDVDALVARIGRARFRDERLYDLSKIPVAFEYLSSYAENIARVCAAIFGKTRKCLVLDLDNTLWGGVIGDDGTSGIQIGEDSGPGEAFRRFQSYARTLKDRGILLAVCSKNDEKIAQEPFLKREEMILKLEDFSCFIANWEPKSDNLRKIASRLNIGLDSLVFVDDNPAEREIVRQHLPEVAVLEVSDDPATYASQLADSGYFEAVAITSEDLARTEQYRSNRGREELLAGSTDYDAYLKSLEMESSVLPFDEIHLPRITQLINKTNQFNLTTPRYTEAKVSELMKTSGALSLYVKLKDRFGDHGLISVFIATPFSEDLLLIDTWLMSCRVLKRGVEDILFKEVLRHAQAQGFKQIQGVYIPTEKNGLVKNHYQDLGFSAAGVGPDKRTLWSFTVPN